MTKFLDLCAALVCGAVCASLLWPVIANTTRDHAEAAGSVIADTLRCRLMFVTVGIMGVWLSARTFVQLAAPQMRERE